MAKRKSASAERYWYAIGFHHALTGVSEPPDGEMKEFLFSTLGIDVKALYDDGWKRGEKDKEMGLI